MNHLDPRIGTLNSGKFYAFAHGYDKPETIGSLEEVEIALGLRTAPAKPAKMVAKREYRDYVVTMTQGGEDTETVEFAKSAAQAISKARQFWNAQDGRTRSVGLLPRSFRARVARSE